MDEHTGSTLDDALAALEHAGVEFALARPPESLNSGLGDVDLVVGRVSPARRVLVGLGFLVAPEGRPDDAVMVRHDRRSGRPVWIHLQSEVHLLGASVASLDLIARRRRSNGIWVLSDSDLLALMVLRALEQRILAERHREPVARLAQFTSHMPPWAAALADRHNLRLDELLTWAAAGDWNRVLSTQVVVPTPLIRDRISGRWLRWRRWWPRRGAVIAIIGPDGAGKSSAVEHLVGSLPGETRSFYMGLTGGRMVDIDRLRVPGVVLIGRVALIWGRWIAVQRSRLGGQPVICDRYPIDGLVPPGPATGAGGQWSRRVQAALCPPPDLAILLDAPGTILHERSLEYDADTLEDWRRRFRDVADRRSWIVVVDADRRHDDVLSEVLEQAWSVYGRRWGQ